MKQTDEAKKRNQELVQLSCKKKRKVYWLIEVWEIRI